MEIETTGQPWNFDLTISCRVRDGSIVGDLAVNVVAAPVLQIGFVGTEFFLDPSYIEQRARCWAALAARYNVKYRGPNRPPGGHSPIDQGILAALPAYIRSNAFYEARQAINMLSAITHLFGSARARGYQKSLMRNTPALALALRLSSKGPLIPKLRERDSKTTLRSKGRSKTRRLKGIRI